MPFFVHVTGKVVCCNSWAYSTKTQNMKRKKRKGSLMGGHYM